MQVVSRSVVNGQKVIEHNMSSRLRPTFSNRHGFTELKLLRDLVDLVGIEPTTSSMPWKRAPSCATGPLLKSTRLKDNSTIFTQLSRRVKLNYDIGGGSPRHLSEPHAKNSNLLPAVRGIMPPADGSGERAGSACRFRARQLRLG